MTRVVEFFDPNKGERPLARGECDFLFWHLANMVFHRNEFNRLTLEKKY